jgi:hypothetical protein
VHAAQGPGLPIEGNAALRKIGLEAVSHEFPAAPGSREKTALIFQLLDFDNKSALEQ